MAAKRRTKTKPAAKKAKKKAAQRKPARKPVRKAARKAVTASSRSAPRGTPAGGLVVNIAPSLEARLRMLATKMGKSLPEAAAQALDEFVETWEDHFQTVAALQESEDRVQLSVPKE